jgi:hypothetical protein
MKNRPGYNPTRRNRNIGTAKQGHGQNNRLRIPSPVPIEKVFYERLGKYTKTVVDINGKPYTFAVEATRKDSQHACSVADVTHVLQQISPDDLEGLDLIIFRQPKRKEEILSPVWGRLIYFYEFENRFCPAIILESQNFTKKFCWSKHISAEDRKELQRLIEDGHPLVDTGRCYEAPYELANVRNTQLYRTVLHEIGHYVQYLDVIARPAAKAKDEEAEREKRWKVYDSIPSSEKENFAHRYAEQKRQAFLATDGTDKHG